MLWYSSIIPVALDSISSSVNSSFAGGDDAAGGLVSGSGSTSSG